MDDSTVLDMVSVGSTALESTIRENFRTPDNFPARLKGKFSQQIGVKELISS
ncbi:uncharacterized protein MYCFIDRAFT_176618 [Pseudocercospora fijiensis CIRAD86]|uniref:Uncharacterized protein n=1 Tax=Pseudocercospora fijiensis (strain CIRAD86) TaxID=383855 RepID=M2ZQI3_PSEFD|nr:uncharacterized protein MYCFIDRAFT_176618 [Pseudocercospora fijiensis CIRAD86]EME81329.1 hypothetical protein MYCFIDRAFT_176618 [Pseudocercospora fijiensis CIRAD86]